MSDRGTVVYTYDGSLDGLLCCVFDSYDRHEEPVDIVRTDDAQGTLFPTRVVETDLEHARRVYDSIGRKMGNEAVTLVTTAFLHGEPGKELAIYRFLRLGYRQGMLTVRMLQHADVSLIHKLARAVDHEQHMLCGFLRFSDYGGNLVATIGPKHFVLPLLGPHFCDRYSGEQFLIHDRTHGMALIYQPRRAQIVPIDDLELPAADDSELAYRRLWAQYYRTIAIQARCNPRCQMGHMPKRFWQHLTEMLPEETGTSRALPSGGFPPQVYLPGTNLPSA